MMGKRHNSNGNLVTQGTALSISESGKSIENEVGLYLEKYLTFHPEGFLKYTNITSLLKAWLPLC